MNSERILSTIFQISNSRITSKSFENKYRIGNAFSRTRKLTFSDMIYFILQSTQKSIPINYATFKNTFYDKTLPWVSKQAISKARQGISENAFLDLFRISVEQFYQLTDSASLWNGFHIFAVDGSTIQIPETEENVRFFGGNPNKTKLLSPLASVSVLYDVLNDILVDVSLHPYRYNERTSAREHINYLPKAKNTIVLFDRGYPSEELFHFLNEQGIFFLMRIPKTFKKAIFKEPDVLFSYPASGGKKDFMLRSYHFTLKDGTTEYLITNLMPKQMDSSLFPSLYCLRWGIESKYRELKNRLEIEHFNSMKPTGIKQEFFSSMYLSNLAAIIKHGADLEISFNNDNKYKYQSNRSYILNQLKVKILFLLRTSFTECCNLIISIIIESSKVLSVIRPNRKFGRYRRHTRRRYYNHIKTCL